MGCSSRDPERFVLTPTLLQTPRETRPPAAPSTDLGPTTHAGTAQNHQKGTNTKKEQAPKGAGYFRARWHFALVATRGWMHGEKQGTSVLSWSDLFSR